MSIVFNSKLGRFEVYGPRSVVRNGEIQPVFVSASVEQAREYVRRAAQE